MARLAFIGNCQIEALYNLYRKYVEPKADDIFRYIRSYESIGHADREFIGESDVVIEQVQDFRPKGDIAGIVTRARRIFVPVVNAGFLWPYAGQPHPLNKGEWFIEGGPFGSEASDAFLNRMINRKVPADEAVARYRDTDVNRAMNLDRLLELSLEKQRARDELAGFEIADVIAQHFRDEPIFRTPYHPNVRVTMALATQFFERMGVSIADTERMRASMLITPFPKEELPLHPSVVEHFGLRYANSQTRYRFLHEGAYTFEEYAERYMRYEWNAALHEGVALARTDDATRAVVRLRDGLAISPRSAQGHATMGHVLHRLGDHQGAIASLKTSLQIEPANAQVCSALAGVFTHLQLRDEAEAAIREAMVFDPFEAHFPTLLSHWLRAWGRSAEALALAERSIALAPYSHGGYSELGFCKEGAGDILGAEACFRRAAELAPEDVGVLTHLALLLSKQERWLEALPLWQRVLDQQPDNGHAREHLIDALRKSGSLPAAIASMEAMLKRSPRDVGLLSRYSAYLLDDNRPTDAVIVLRTATLIEPRNPKLYQELVQLCQKTGDHAGVEAALRQLMAINPEEPGPVVQLGHLLAAQKRWTEMRAAVDTALALGGEPVGLLCLLATMFQETGDIESAATALAQAVAASPQNGDLHYQLSKAWHKLGRLREAVAAASAGVAVNPRNPHWQSNLGYMLSATGDYDEAEKALRAAVEVNPMGAGFRSALADILLLKGDAAAAVIAASEAVALAPDQVHYRNRLAHMERALAREEPMAAERIPPTARVETVVSVIEQARLLLDGGDAKASHDLLAEAAQQEPPNGDVFYWLSHVCTVLNRADEALAAAQRAVDLQPTNPHWLVRLGDLQMNAGAPDAAEMHLRSAITIKPDIGGFHDALGRVLFRKGMLDQAIAAVREAVRLDAENIHFLEHLSQLLHTAGDTGGAIVALERAVQIKPENSHFVASLERLRLREMAPVEPSVATAAISS
jgi:tetratricopeptide (TPR) repeat protein